MEHMILDAYKMAKTKDFFSITKALERLMRQRYGTASRLVKCTTKDVMRILRKNDLKYNIMWQNAQRLCHTTQIDRNLGLPKNVTSSKCIH